MKFPENLKYTKEHEWIKVEGNVAILGVSDHAQSELGDVVYVDIDEDLEEVEAGSDFGTIEAVKTVADLYSPVDGKVKEINSAINDNPETINSDPYGDGWLIKIEMSDSSQLDSLMDTDTYKDFVGQ
ncbi:glycine cleavage system protein GcvH [Candidatus Kapabacteria bacterium]|nr:glycine cleavage system protein GcvH [Candidatus Kapabacteria bacterium]